MISVVFVVVTSCDTAKSKTHVVVVLCCVVFVCVLRV